jgi:hypothetical protein
MEDKPKEHTCARRTGYRARHKQLTPTESEQAILSLWR